MARLIDATPIIDECVECMNIEWNKSVYTTWAEAEEDFKDRLLDAPVVDAVEVVRCKDCVHRHRRHNCDGRPMDFFCADGERRFHG